LLGLLEAGVLGGEAIGAGQEEGRLIVALVIGEDVEWGARFDVGDT
jgi:hypothetical protein